MLTQPLKAFKLILVCLPIGIRTAASIETTNGTVLGFVDQTNGVEKFLGIPFAEPPVGGLRLQQATPLKHSFGSIEAAKFGHSCYGKTNRDGASEDCLTLNIWKPISLFPNNQSIPVLVWLYGGGLTDGYGADPTFEGTAMVNISSQINKPMILVTLNYRLGPFGFLNGKEMAQLGLLNIGMLDQRLALQWIQENIAAFGGDPDKVTLAGQSAGAVSTYSHMMAYGGRNDKLFRAAILQSGGAFPLTPPDTISFQSTFDSLILNTTCRSVVNGSAIEKLECIRNLPTEKFIDDVGSSTGQSIDGSFSRTSIQRALPEGRYIKIPTLIGTNTDVGTTSAPTGINTTEQLFDPLARGYFRPKRLPNDTVSTMLELYPHSPSFGCPYNTGDAILSSGKLDKKACAIFGDLVQVAPARMIAQMLAKDGVPVFKYRFNHLPQNTSKPEEGITTGIEQAYVFSNEVLDAAWDQNLAYQMSAAWISFTHDLDPNLDTEDIALSKWPRYDSNEEEMVFNGYGSRAEPDKYRSKAIDYMIEHVLPYGAS